MAARQTENASHQSEAERPIRQAVQRQHNEQVDAPELLRWRAETLLDEMMLGAVDIAAGRPATGQQTIGRSNAQAAGDIPPHSAAPRPVNPYDESFTIFDRKPAVDGQWGEQRGPSTQAASKDHPADPRPLPLEARPPLADQTRSHGVVTPDSHSGDTDTIYAGWSERDASASAPMGAARSPADKDRRAWREGVDDQGASLTPTRPDGADQNGAEQMLRQPYAQRYSGSDQNTGAVATRDQYSSDQARSAGARSNKKRTNLLPRASSVDVRLLIREIDDLDQEVEATLPRNHEWGIRARHLLAKGAAILEENPERSAEVEYYIQQVRAILTRSQQTYDWSRMYQHRLRLYLIAWLLLGFVVVVGAGVYLRELINLGVVAGFFTADSIAALQIVPLACAVFAGAMGGALGALYNMKRHGDQGGVFFDRKYSLRGLILPLLSALFGFVLYLLFGIVFALARVDPSANLWIGLLPALVAFLYGIMQESIFGTAT